MAVPQMATSSPVPVPVPTLYVGDLHVEVTDANLFDLFITVGALTSVRVCRDSTTGRSLGYGAMAVPQMATSSPVPVLVPVLVPTLYVGDLHVEVTDANHFDLFITVGALTSVRVCRDSTTGRSLGYGYVNYSSSQDAPPAPATGGTQSHTSAPLRSSMMTTTALISSTVAPDVCSGPMSSAVAAFPNSHSGPRLHCGLSL